jgi:hypothetical protein
MADVTPLPTANQTVEAPPRPIIATVQWKNLWTAAGGLAGALGIVYAVGASVEALRLHHAGLPVEQAISVVPRTSLATLAVNALLLPAAISAIIAAVAIAWSQKFTEREPDAAQVEMKRLKQQTRAERREERMRHAGRVRRTMRRVLTAVFSSVLGPAWSATFGRLPTAIQGWAFIGVVYVLFIPWTLAGLIGLLFNAVQLWVIGHVARHRALRIISRRREVVLIAVAAGLLISAQTMAREVTRPGPLPRVGVKVVGQPSEIRGDYIATTAEGVYLGMGRRVVVIPDRRVDRTIIWNAPEQKQEDPATLLSRVE